MEYQIINIKHDNIPRSRVAQYYFVDNNKKKMY